MFLQYAVWGVWLPVLATYLQSPVAGGGLGFTSGQVGLIIGAAGSIGAVSAPFIAGQFADRYFSTEKFLAVLLVLGGTVKLILSFQDSFTAWLLLARPAGVPTWSIAVAAVTAVLSVAVTVVWSVPAHARLGAEFDATIHHRLVRTNWIRTWAWTLHGANAVAMLVRAG